MARPRAVGARSSGARLVAAALMAVLALSLPACGTLSAVQSITGGTALSTQGSSRSMVFVAPTAVGPIVIDLGWTGAETELARVLRASGWTPADVAAVFLTHAHRDHIAAWPLVAGAPFYLAEAEVPLFTGREAPKGPVDGLADDVRPAPRPAPGELELRPFGTDTMVVLGSDTVRAFLVPGHTRGSAAYLFRGVLFVGDAGFPRPSGRLGGPHPAFSEDPEAGAAALARLLAAVEGLDVRYVCTAHAQCYDYGEAREDVSGLTRQAFPVASGCGGP